MFFICFHLFVFFFKQKTAYEMRISDWSSDVCSSDLCAAVLPVSFPKRSGFFGLALGGFLAADFTRFCVRIIGFGKAGGLTLEELGVDVHALRLKIRLFRSEEHTSELQSLIRISYAVFCLKKKTMLTDPPHTDTHSIPK